MKNLFEATECNQTEIVEFRLHGDQSDVDEDSYLVCGELRISSSEIELGDRLFVWGLRKAHILTKLAGCTIARGSRLNDDPPADAAISETITSRKTKGRKLELSGSVTADGGEAKAAAGVQASHSIEQVLISEVVEQRMSIARNVTCKPNGRWEVVSSNPSDQDIILDDTYLSNTALFAVTGEQGSNRVEVIGELVARKRDVVVKEEGKRRGLLGSSSPNKEKVLGLVMSNALEQSMVNDVTQGNASTLVIARAKVMDAED